MNMNQLTFPVAINVRRSPAGHSAAHYSPVTTFIAIALFSLFSALLSTRAQATDPLDQEVEFDIPAGTPLESALITWAHATGMQIMMSTTAVAHLTAPAVHGKFRAADLLDNLLRGSGLIYTVDGATLRVVRQSSVPSDSSSRPRLMSDAPAPPSRTPDGIPRQPGTSSVEPSRLTNLPPVALPITLREVVVTAEKRAETVQNVPMSMTALTTAQLSGAAAYQFQDYVGKVPGLTLIDDGALGSQLVIRGLTSGGTAVNSPVAVYIDETPYTAAGPWAGSFLIAPNLDTFDMQRIEVLRGPQGTLYGAQALGGLLKYVTNAPDPTRFSATVEAGGSSVYNGTAGYDVHAMVNLPLTSNTALRIVGYNRYYPGFVDDPSRNREGINGTHFTGGRLSMLYAPSPAFSARFTALYQRRSWADNGNEDVASGSLAPIYGPLVQERIVNQSGYSRDELYNLTLNFDCGFAKLLSSTSDSEFQDSGVVDYSAEFGPTVSSILGAPYGMVDIFQPHDKSVTQEIRLSSSAHAALDWQLGVFYTDQRGADVENFFPTDLSLHQIVYTLPTNLGAAVVPVRYRESAGYADFDYHISQHFDIGLGGRYSSNTQKFHELASGVFFGPTDLLTTSSENDFTYSTDLRWRPSQTQTIYGRIATGYQPGGPNDVPLTSPGASRSYASSTATSYELGLKEVLLDSRLRADLDVFDVDWRKIQVEAVIGGFNTFTNGGTARSTGVEWQFDYLPVPGLTLSANGAYTHAYLTAQTPASVNGHAGDRLPGTPLLSGSASVRYGRSITNDLSADAEIAWRYTGSRYADFTAVGARQEMPSFNIVDLRFGIRAIRWSANIFVKNVTNKLALDYVRPETLLAGGAQSAVVYLPRTLGLNLTVTF